MIVKKILARPSLVAGIVIVLAFLIVALAAPVIAPPEGDSPYLIPRDGVGPIPRPPSPTHPLGTLEDQYDVFYGLIWGIRAAFRVGLIVTLSRVAIGVLLGLLSGYYGGLVDAVAMRTADAFMSFPIISPVMVGLLVLPFTDEQTLVLVLVLFGWMSYARLMRGNVLSAREMEYVEAARATGAQSRRIIFRHLLPNSTHGLFVLVASDIGAVVVLVTAFTFIRLVGNYVGRLMSADWGQMLSQSRNWIIGTPANAFEYWYTYIPVSLAIVLFAIGWNLIGDGLRDVLDPRMQ